MPTNPRSPFTLLGITLTVLASFVTACTFVDDEPRIPFEPSDTDTDSAGSSECLTAAEQVQATCEPPQQFFFMMGEEASLVLVDDPMAVTQVGPSGWLVQAPSASHYVGSQYYGDGHCTVGCGWCQPGQSLCHSGSEAADVSGCMLCMPWDTPDPEAQCAQLVEACAGADDEGDTGSDEPLDEPVPDETTSGETGSDGSSGGTGSESDSGSSTGSADTGSERGLDETGSGSIDSGDTGSEGTDPEPGLDETGS